METKQIKVNHSILKAFSIIETMAEAGIELSLQEISTRTNLPKATALRLIYTLMTIGYIHQNNANSFYILSEKFNRFSSQTFDEVILRAKPAMQRIAEATKEAVNLSILEQDQLTYIDSVDSQDNLLSITQKIGKKAPLYCTGAGKIYLSQFPAEKYAQYLDETALQPLTEYTYHDPKCLTEELKRIKTQGYSIDHEECEIGVRCVAVPVFDQQEKVLCTISVSVPSVRATTERMDAIIEILAQEANTIYI